MFCFCLVWRMLVFCRCLMWCCVVGVDRCMMLVVLCGGVVLLCCRMVGMVWLKLLGWWVVVMDV